MSLVHIEVSSSTLRQPFLFFTELIKVNPLSSAIKSFTDQIPGTSENSLNQYPLKKVSKDKLTFVVEINVDNVEYATELDEWVTTPSKIWINKTYTFKEELHKRLKSEFFNSCKLLAEKWDRHGYDKNTPMWFRQHLGELVNCLKIVEQKKELKKYQDEFVRPYHALIRHLYFKYNSFLPNTYPDSKIGDIIKDAAYSAPLYTPYNIKASIYSDIAYLEDKYGNSFFGFTNPAEIEESLKLFGAKRYNEIASPINFPKKSKAAYYLIREIRHLINMDIQEIIAANVIFFAGKPFTRTSYDTNPRRINITEKVIIDNLIQNSLF